MVDIAGEKDRTRCLTPCFLLRVCTNKRNRKFACLCACAVRKLSSPSEQLFLDPAEHAPGAKRNLPETMTLQPCAKGTVVRITVDNFTTFACKRTFHPSPGLNILCGPNGSGKSSIVSAICLGLGFPEKVIDNKKKAADYISKGSSFCEIEIQLSDGGMRRSTFSRKFFSSKTSKDVFKINGERVASRNAYLARVRDEYKIRLENATQYLPQSKLEKFKRLSPKDRLTATLEAVAPEMLQERETIEKADEYKAEREKALATSKTLADQAKKDLEKANKDAAGIREKLESNDTLHLLHLGILAKERQELRARVTEHKAATKNIKEKFRAAKAAVDVAVEAEAAAQASIAEQRKAANVTAKDLYKCSRLVKNRADDTHKSLQVRLGCPLNVKTFVLSPSHSCSQIGEKLPPLHPQPTYLALLLNCAVCCCCWNVRACVAVFANYSTLPLPSRRLTTSRTTYTRPGRDSLT